MSISADVVIMTRSELEEVKTNSFLRGVRRGRFEERCEQNNPQSGAVEKQDSASPGADGGPKSSALEWQQVLDLFARFGAPPPPTKLRDEIVGYRYALKELIAAEDADHDQLRDAFEEARHALNIR